MFGARLFLGSLHDATNRKPTSDQINEARAEILCKNGVKILEEAENLKPSIGLEPMTPSLPWKCSTN